MNLSYYLDLKSLCNANTKQMELFFRLAFDILVESQNFSDSLFEESFIRDDDDDVLLLNHKSGQSLYEIFFYTFSGEIGNRIIPNILQNFGSQNSKINDKIPYGEENGKIYPNAKLATPQKTKYLWLLSELAHYYEFRQHHIYDRVLSNNCDEFIVAYFSNIYFTKDALKAYKILSYDDKRTLIDDLEELDGYISRKWENNTTFPIEDFSKITGVDASDESDTTKTNSKLKRQRLFSIPDLGSIYCFHHIKISNTYRVHFYADPNTKKAYIAYVGKHLRTAKNR
jgi:hypothetical protein